MTIPRGYERLAKVLEDALEQSASGKGKERHANDLAFENQPMQSITAMVGYGFPLGQVMKKTQEAGGMLSRSEYDHARAELLGVIVYAAGAIVALDREAEAEKRLRVQREAARLNMASYDLRSCTEVGLTIEEVEWIRNNNK